MADGGEDGVGGVASGSLELAAAEMAFGFHMADHRLDGRSASQRAKRTRKCCGSMSSSAAKLDIGTALLTRQIL